MKCYWCGNENNNVELDYETLKVIRSFPCNICNQPERLNPEAPEIYCSIISDFPISQKNTQYPTGDAIV